MKQNCQIGQIHNHSGKLKYCLQKLSVTVIKDIEYLSNITNTHAFAHTDKHTQQTGYCLCFPTLSKHLEILTRYYVQNRLNKLLK